MKKNGFTLVELLAVIIIFSLITLIAVPSYASVLTSTNNLQYENKKNYILTSSLKYASDNNILNETITVSTLIDLGYLNKDNDSKEDYQSIINPLGGYFDCDLIEIIKDYDTYNIELISNNNCNLTSLKEKEDYIDISIYLDNKKENLLYTINDDPVWTNKDLYVYVDLKEDISIDNKITYVNCGSVSLKNIDTIPVKIDALVYLDTICRITINTNIGLITKEIPIKIDKEKPLIEVKNNLNKIRVVGLDGSGSGIDSYSLSNNNNYLEFIYQEEELNNLELDNGIYYLYAKDKAGNISDCYKILINNI